MTWPKGLSRKPILRVPTWLGPPGNGFLVDNRGRGKRGQNELSTDSSVILEKADLHPENVPGIATPSHAMRTPELLLQGGDGKFEVNQENNDFRCDVSLA